jgi:hypothetical protein
MIAEPLILEGFAALLKARYTERTPLLRAGLPIMCTAERRVTALKPRYRRTVGTLRAWAPDSSALMGNSRKGVL